MDESILAALVEGDLGGREADAVRERLLAADPDLAARVELIERDRVMLRALGDETPPTGLAESVVARLEREALLGLSGGDADRSTLAVSVVRPVRRRSGPAGWMTSPAGAGLAMAAVLTLAVGATMYFAGGKSPGPVAPVETADAGLLPGGTALAQENTGGQPGRPRRSAGPAARGGGPDARRRHPRYHGRSRCGLHR